MEIIYSSNILFVVVDGKVNVSSNGFTYTDTGVGENLDITSIDSVIADISWDGTDTPWVGNESNKL